MTTLGLIGSGLIGSTLAKLAVENGYAVVLSNSRGPETLSGLVAELGPKARAASPREAAAAADLVVVTIPFGNYRKVPVTELAGKTVIDTNNYFPGRDGRFPELDAKRTTSSELLQEHLASSKVVKAFNHIDYRDLYNLGVPAGADGRLAIPISGDDEAAKSTVTGLIDGFGFDTVDAGALSEGWRFDPSSETFESLFDRDQVIAAMAREERTPKDR